MQRAALRSPSAPDRAVLARAAGPAPKPYRRRRRNGTVAGPDRGRLSTELVGKSVAKPGSGWSASQLPQRRAAALTATRRGPFPSLRPVFHGRRRGTVLASAPPQTGMGRHAAGGRGQRPRHRQARCRPARGRSRPTAAPAKAIQRAAWLSHGVSPSLRAPPRCGPALPQPGLRPTARRARCERGGYSARPQCRAS